MDLELRFWSEESTQNLAIPTQMPMMILCWREQMAMCNIFLPIVQLDFVASKILLAGMINISGMVNLLKRLQYDIFNTQVHIKYFWCTKCTSICSSQVWCCSVQDTTLAKIMSLNRIWQYINPHGWLYLHQFLSTYLFMILIYGLCTGTSMYVNIITWRRMTTKPGFSLWSLIQFM